MPFIEPKEQYGLLSAYTSNLLFCFHSHARYKWRELGFSATYSDLEGPRDINVWKMASEDPSITPTAMIAGWSSHWRDRIIFNKHRFESSKIKM